MATSPQNVAINMADLKANDEIDGPRKNQQNGYRHSPNGQRNGHGNGHHDYDSDDDHHHRHRHDRGHRNPSYHSGSESDTEDEGEDDSRSNHSHSHHHRHHHRRRSTSSERHQSAARRARGDIEAPTPDRSPRSRRDLASANADAEPLLDTEMHTKRKTELHPDDETLDDSVPNTSGHHPGVDDGFFTSSPPTSTTIDFEGTELVPAAVDEAENIPKINPNSHGERPLSVPDPFPFAPGFNTNVILDAHGNPQVIPDINVYQQKKNLAQGMMDLALLSANANQLRYVIESYPRHPYYWFSFVTITISLVLQIVVGVGLILNSRYNVKNRDQICRADRINNATVIGIFLITIVNVFIAAFGVADSAPGQ